MVSYQCDAGVGKLTPSDQLAGTPLAIRAISAVRCSSGAPPPVLHRWTHCTPHHPRLCQLVYRLARLAASCCRTCIAGFGGSTSAASGCRPGPGPSADSRPAATTASDGPATAAVYDAATGLLWSVGFNTFGPGVQLIVRPGTNPSTGSSASPGSSSDQHGSSPSPCHGPIGEQLPSRECKADPSDATRVLHEPQWAVLD